MHATGGKAAPGREGLSIFQGKASGYRERSGSWEPTRILEKALYGLLMRSGDVNGKWAYAQRHTRIRGHRVTERKR